MSTRAVIAGIDRGADTSDEDGAVTRGAITTYAWVAYLGVSGILALLYLFGSRFQGN